MSRGMMSSKVSARTTVSRRPDGSIAILTAGPVASDAGRTDDRWPTLAAALGRLREAGRRSIRIVDADCGHGDLLLRAVIEARRLGFTAIEARGIDGSPALIARARIAASALHDPAIGLLYETADVRAALNEEAGFPADMVLWRERPGALPDMAEALCAAGRTVIGHAAA